MKQVRLDELCEISVGRTPARNDATLWGTGEPWLAISDMNQGLWIRHTREQITAAGAAKGRVVKPGTVLLSFKLSIGKVAIAGVPLYTNEAIAALPVRDPSQLDERYLLRALESMDLAGDANRAAMGGTLNKAKLKQIAVPLPGIDEQRRIAAILDHADALRAKRRQVLAHLDDLTRAAFTRESGDSKSAEGRTVPLAELASVVTKGTTPTSVGLHFANEGVPFLRAQNLQRGTVVFGSGDLHIDEPSHQYLSRSQIEPQDLLISIAGTIGRVAVVPEDAPTMNCNQAVAIVRLHDRSLAPWMRSWLQSEDARRQINASAVTATISNLSLSQIRQLQVPEVSEDVARSFATLDAAVAHNVKAVERAAAADDRLFSSLQSRAFRGEL